jgi:hypothetical protein
LKPVVTGNAVLAELPSDVTGRATRRKRIVIVTSSFFGLWSSLSSVEAEDGGGIERLARLLSEQPDWDVVIKSHPVADFHALYDAIVTRVAHPNLTHVRTYWPNEEFAVCTAAVVCGGVTGAILQLQRAGVPAIYLADRLAEAWSRELHFDYAGVGWAVASPDEACEAVRRLATDDAFRAEVRARGRQFLDGYRGDSANAMQTFATLLSKLAHGDSPPSPVSSEVG